eukprot:gnl/MRDRNA2_/MRDRNA2_72982_c0_seq1.p1 gnl/MRDRNA2_/MRDRNA2_72982_c0~~gnl/MRDRNA2_/MRDRNA2_72982_c0_seq1.p1  ORF type:complete len:246 (+),score=40.87 gnl/MRDRNA2_/MRDRNA2_72982_c0_seq1:22-759(+)
MNLIRTSVKTYQAETNAVAHGGGGDWNMETVGGRRLWYRIEPDGAVTCQVVGTIGEPLFRICSLMYEVDLHSNWIPFLTKAKQLHDVRGSCGTKASSVFWQEYILPPPLSMRDVVCYAFGSNALNDPDIQGIVVHAESVPGHEWWGYPLPAESKSAVRLDMRSLSFVLKPSGDQNEHTDLIFVLSVDPKVSFLPHFFVNWLAKESVNLVFSNIASIGAKFDETEYAERVRINSEFYGWLKDRLHA